MNDWLEHFNKYYSDNYSILDLTCKNDMHRFLSWSQNNIKIIGVINYDLIWRKKELETLKDFTLMLDESSLVKNYSAKRSKFIITKLKFKNIILLSGTPCDGKYENLWTQCLLLGWYIKKKDFWNMFINYRVNQFNNVFVKEVISYKNIDVLISKLHSLGCVFMKTEDVLELPEKNIILQKCKANKEYKQFKKSRVITINDKDFVGDNPLTKLLYMRQMLSIYNKERHKQLNDLIESSYDRLVIFYNFNAELEIIKKIIGNDRPISIINGSTKDLTNYERYNNCITLVQYQAGAMGINLQLSNKIIYYSLPLSSEIFEQSKKRIHRLGQSKPCFYYILVAENTIEEIIYNTLLTRNDYTLKLFESDFKE